jgi:hypothetical protein
MVVRRPDLSPVDTSEVNCAIPLLEVSLDIDVVVDQAGPYVVDFQVLPWYSGRLVASRPIVAGPAVVDVPFPVPQLAMGQDALIGLAPPIGRWVTVTATVPWRGPSLHCDVAVRVVPPTEPAVPLPALGDLPCRAYQGTTGYAHALLQADVPGPWTIEVDNGGLSSQAELGLLIAEPADAGTLSVGTPVTSPVVPVGRAVRFSVPATAGDQLVIVTAFTAALDCVDAILLRPDGALAAKTQRCGESLVERAYPLELSHTADATGVWELVVFNDVSFPAPQSFTVERR